MPTRLRSAAQTVVGNAIRSGGAAGGRGGAKS